MCACHEMAGDTSPITKLMASSTSSWMPFEPPRLREMTKNAAIRPKIAPEAPTTGVPGARSDTAAAPPSPLMTYSAR